MVMFKALYDAYLRCRKHKRNTHNALIFEINLIENLTNLETSLNDYSYTLSRSVCFLTSSPKLREVFAADFRDRVVHHLIVPILEKVFEPKFIYDSYYHKVKGTTIRLPKMLWILNRIVFHDVTQDAIIKGDKKLINKLPENKTLFKVSKDYGLPIGNLTSQFFANIYMNGFDNFVKRTLKAKHYLRYVDDFVLFSSSKEQLQQWHVEIAEYLHKELGLKLRNDFRLRRNSEGLDFLGYIIRPYYILSRQRVVKNYKQKKAKYLCAYENQKGKMDLEEIKKFLSVQASFMGHIKHANSYNLQRKIGVLNESNPFHFDGN